jgi:hypothetical protein
MKRLAYVPPHRIATARDKSAFYAGRGTPAHARYFLRQRLMRSGHADKLSLLDGDPPKNAKKIDAFIDAQRWICKCECGGAEVVDPEDPIFFCLSCLNESTKGRMRPVRFPKKIKSVEKAQLAKVSKK